MNGRAAFSIRFAGGGTLELGRKTCVMGIINATPDSFADGGRHLEPSAALDAAAEMADAGAELIDVGGESTRPGADPVDAAAEADRILPIVEAIKRELRCRVSVDTLKADVARQALDAGADMVNDVSAMRDPAMLPLVVERDVPVVLMHMRGTPRTMQRETGYDDLVAAVRDFLSERAGTALAGGIGDDKIILDPGLGFGKSAAGNLTILRELPTLGRLGRPILIGASRKSFIGEALDLTVDERLEGSLAAAAYASAQGAHIIRAHDVAQTVRAVRMIDAIREA